MIRFFLSLFCTVSFSWALVVGTYNVENLFDDIYQGTEYESYIPENTQGWNKEMAAKKLANISEAILKIDADILALQEVENEQILIKLAKKTGYLYHSFASSLNAATGVGILSRHPILTSETIKSNFRPALYVKIEVEKKPLEFIVVHWPSLKNPNTKREEAARDIAPFMKNIDEGIVLGDFNTPFDLKNTISRFWGPIEETKGWFDPWVGIKDRWSHSFFGDKKVLDRMLLSEKLFDGEGFDYVCGSFK
ncbi:MAG: endonuclease/exonuclease/phosphatase family protein, partial [Campylobacteraceae bacterium]|nr:endonuclease/exonuclease/phosphatase family protein [Campylobacteraceae bacterium]